jgi:hypothetical protein
MKDAYDVFRSTPTKAIRRIAAMNPMERMQLRKKRRAPKAAAPPSTTPPSPPCPIPIRTNQEPTFNDGKNREMVIQFGGGNVKVVDILENGNSMQKTELVMGFMSYMTVQIIEELKTMGEWDKFANGPEHIEKVGMAEDMGDKDDDKMPSGESEKHGGASEGIYNPDRSLEFFLTLNYSSAKYALILSVPCLQHKTLTQLLGFTEVPEGYVLSYVKNHEGHFKKQS